MTTDWANADQRNYMNDLARNPDKVCACGWYWKHECNERFCANTAKRDATIAKQS